MIEAVALDTSQTNGQAAGEAASAPGYMPSMQIRQVRDALARAILFSEPEETGAPHFSPALLDWNLALDGCEEIAQVVALLRVAGFERAADRLAQIQEELDGEEISVASAKGLAAFLKLCPELGPPSIGLSADGSLTAEWHPNRDSHLAISCRDEGWVSFALLTLDPVDQSIRRLNGAGPIRQARNAVASFWIG